MKIHHYLTITTAVAVIVQDTMTSINDASLTTHGFLHEFLYYAFPEEIIDFDTSLDDSIIVSLHVACIMESIKDATYQQARETITQLIYNMDIPDNMHEFTPEAQNVLKKFL